MSMPFGGIKIKKYFDIKKINKQSKIFKPLGSIIKLIFQAKPPIKI